MIKILAEGARPVRGSASGLREQKASGTGSRAELLYVIRGHPNALQRLLHLQFVADEAPRWLVEVGCPPPACRRSNPMKPAAESPNPTHGSWRAGCSETGTSSSEGRPGTGRAERPAPRRGPTPMSSGSPPSRALGEELEAQVAAGVGQSSVVRRSPRRRAGGQPFCRGQIPTMPVQPRIPLSRRRLAVAEHGSSRHVRRID